MAPVVFKNPHLPDYFLPFPEVTADAPADAIPSVVQPFESGRVIVFPNLRLVIDHGFWASLPTDAYPDLKKLPSRPPERPGEPDEPLDNRLAKGGAPPELARRLREEIGSVYAQALPLYERLFDGYRFTRRHAVWRLNTIMNENMHVDTYPQAFQEHFARMFINLDDQPRIWHTSWPIAEMYRRFAGRVGEEVAAGGDADLFRTHVNRRAFGAGSQEWWDSEPRHVVYFQPGDVWIVDSRQVAHQIFYGRRAASIDFFVERASMRRPGRHYLKLAERLRTEALERSAAEPTSAEAQ
ncbi:MAG TPA: Kdo hydroxylase family protein [Caulobacteraceae bacterium]